MYIYMYVDYLSSLWQVLDSLKLVILRCFKDEDRRKSSKWIQGVCGCVWVGGE